ncbi:MAG: MltA domain-containing protein [Candidatus Accumulibacter sp.]|jgi:membrane-bound lytic murein transglycosylase A|nr:MltA domain-containing protein [Accumulibacter sp.]
MIFRKPGNESARISPSLGFPATFGKALCCALLGVLLTGCPSLPEAPPMRAPDAPSPASSVPSATTQSPPIQPADWADLPAWDDDDLRGVLSAFRHSCRALSKRAYWPLWRTACEDAERLPADDGARLRGFFESQLRPYLLTNPDGSTQGRVTGYYEPLLRGARERSEVYAHPLLGTPPDLLTIDLSEVAPDLKNRRLRGRLVGRRVLPYFSRADIVAREAAYSEHALFWVDDAVELFFLQIQGSGRIRLPDGNVVRVGYADQNGHPFRPIGNVLLKKGEIGPHELSMQGIQAWARAHPEELDDVLNANPSYVFFRELTGRVREDEGPLGALGVPLTPGRSIAVDSRMPILLGAPVFLSTTYPNSPEPLRRLVMAQDTGGAIRGVVRADFFWGFGADAGRQAGKMKQTGRMWVLLPPALAALWLK